MSTQTAELEEQQEEEITILIRTDGIITENLSSLPTTGLLPLIATGFEKNFEILFILIVLPENNLPHTSVPNYWFKSCQKPPKCTIQIFRLPP